MISPPPPLYLCFNDPLIEGCSYSSFPAAYSLRSSITELKIFKFMWNVKFSPHLWTDKSCFDLSPSLFIPISLNIYSFTHICRYHPFVSLYFYLSTYHHLSLSPAVSIPPSPPLQWIGLGSGPFGQWSKWQLWQGPDFILCLLSPLCMSVSF